MTPHEFITKWRNVELKERSASQSHFNDLCSLLGIDDPITADPKGEWFTFEKGATKTSGGEGWADVWRKGCFAWEYKGHAANLDKAFDQLLRYSIALESPPLLIVSDMERIRIHTNWTNTVQRVHEITLDDLSDAAKRETLLACFEDPERLRPAKTRQMLTEEAAREFAVLAQRLRDRGNEAHKVAHFVIRLVFCMFAEDVNLLPNKMFQRMLEASKDAPEQFTEHARTLFAAMRSGGMVGFEKVEWFNGSLFDDDSVLPLKKADIENLLAAAKLFWDEIDPSILGTLFERGLDPDKRSQLGAHYTDRDKIMQIIGPVIIEPLQREWEASKARISELIEHAPVQTKDRLLRGNELAARTKALNEASAIHRGFLDRVRGFRVLDPACGSGNFLNLSLIALKDIEHRANLEAEQFGLPREFPRVGPENVLGIELNPYAAELARVSVWIGEIQWMRRNGFDASRNPILRSLQNVECRDAVLDENGERAEWPTADVVVGNPPFLGNKKMIKELGSDYTGALRRAWPQVPGGVDLVCYWFAGAWDRIVEGKLGAAGLVATNSIRGGANRTVLKSVADSQSIFSARSDEEWTVEGASVRVSLVCFRKGIASDPVLNGTRVPAINADLTGGAETVDLTKAVRLSSNMDRAFQGVKFGGPFSISGDQARAMLLAPVNPNGQRNAAVIRRWFTGLDLTRRVEERWCIDFGSSARHEDAVLFELPYQAFETMWHEENLIRAKKGEPALRAGEANTLATPWIHQRSRPEMRAALKGLSRFIATPEVSKHRVFVWLKEGMVASGSVYSIARDDDTTFGILHSRFHEVWALRLGTSLEDRPRYTPSSTFETFPFPDGLTLDKPASSFASNPYSSPIAAAAARLNELRDNWLYPSDLVRREAEVVSGFPDRIVPVDDAAGKVLAKRTLTNLYNARPAWLDQAHRNLDAAVADAYGWGDDYRGGRMTDGEILNRLFRLNQERS